MRQTTNLALNLPEGPDNYNVNDYNVNFDIIDEKMKYLSDHISGKTISQIKVVDGAIKDAKRDQTITGNQARIVDEEFIGIGINSSLQGDRNGNLNCNVTQMRYVPYLLEVDIEDWTIGGLSSSSSGSEYNSNYFSLFTFGTNKSTLWGLYFDVRSELNTGERLEQTVLKFRPQSGTETTIAEGSEIEPEDFIGKTVKLYLNCGLDENNKIIYTNNSFVLQVDNDILGSGDFANYAGTGWDQMCNIGWSSYNWGAFMLKISEYRCSVLTELQ